MKILIAEDESKLLESLQAYFKAAGHTVAGTETGQGAIDALRSDAPDVLLLDMWLKDAVTGLQVLKEAKRIAPKTTVIVITGLEEESIEEEALKLGALSLLRKPIRLDELEQLVVKASHQARPIT